MPTQSVSGIRDYGVMIVEGSAVPEECLVVLVNGIPGAGKTTLSRPLTQELGLPLFGKDTIKETCQRSP